MGKMNIPHSFAHFTENGVGGVCGHSRVGQVGAKGRGGTGVRSPEKGEDH